MDDRSSLVLSKQRYHTIVLPRIISINYFGAVFNSKTMVLIRLNRSIRKYEVFNCRKNKNTCGIFEILIVFEDLIDRLRIDSKTKILVLFLLCRARMISHSLNHSLNHSPCEYTRFRLLLMICYFYKRAALAHMNALLTYLRCSSSSTVSNSQL